MKKVFVAGHRGLVGSALVRAIGGRDGLGWIGEGREGLNLLNREDVFRYINTQKPDAVIVAAAKVGGIGANNAFPVEFLSENLQIMTNILDACHQANIERVVYLGSSCIYPRMANQPIREEELLTGELEPTNEAYALAKISGLKLVQAYRKQYGRNWISVMPTNLYGPEDNFDAETSHVLPPLVARFHAAKEAELSTVQVWGTGTPRREFLHVDDLADACLFLLENYNGDIPLNIGFGEDVSIRELTELVAEVVGYKGAIGWDTTKPDGTPRKWLDSSRLREQGWKPKISLREGLESTYKWYTSNLDAGK
jgi:GDP-L-fucose synthase